MKFDKKYNQMRLSAASSRRDERYHQLYDVPREIQSAVNKGDVLEVLRLRRGLWRKIKARIGVVAMHSLFDGLTTITELLTFYRELSEEKAQKLMELTTN
jgi:hypothetical protein